MILELVSSSELFDTHLYTDIIKQISIMIYRFSIKGITYCHRSVSYIVCYNIFVSFFYLLLIHGFVTLNLLLYYRLNPHSTV